MIAVRLICVGKLKERFYQDACAEYVKRLGAYCRLDICELPEEAGRPDGLRREGVRVLESIPAGAYVIALCIEGETMSSEQLAGLLSALQTRGVSRIALVIGSSEGLDPAVKQRADLRLSMSPMTFPHHLARVMVLEQLYRALSIAAGAKYHK